MVITSRTRNAVVLFGHVGSNPTLSAIRNEITPTSWTGIGYNEMGVLVFFSSIFLIERTAKIKA